MCGIAGIISYDRSDHGYITIMTNSLRHRGPDNYGFYSNERVSLGHRRLSIVDLSSNANQPMQNEEGYIFLVCNGEIYNYKEKKIEMISKGHRFRSESDCEVLIHLYEQYGDDFLSEVNGMFAFAIWDSCRRRMVVAVDRFGKKPLYFGFYQGRFVLASELKALLFFKWLKQDLDFLAMDRYLSFRHIPAPMTILKSVKKLEPSTMLIWENETINFKRYWSPKYYHKDCFDAETTVDEFKDVLTDAVKLRLQSDVPLGIYLSGGVDSAAIGGLMKALMDGKKVSYTFGVDYKYDESDRAKKLAEYLDFEYNKVTVTQKDFDEIPNIMYHMDEPFADLLCLPSFLLAKKAKEKLTVVLTGDGADEILNGYFHQRLMLLQRKYDFILKIPFAGNVIGEVLHTIPTYLLNMFFDYPDKLGEREKLKLSQAMLNSNKFGAFYETVTSCFTPQDKKRLYKPGLMTMVRDKPISDEIQKELDVYGEFTFLSQLSILDLKYWLPFSVIYRLDKMNMAHAVEARSPFLDYRVVEMALNLPDKFKLNRKRNKEILRCLIDRLFPPPHREKGKQAFYMPVTPEFKKRYLEWASSLLNRKSVEQRGFFHWPYINQLFKLSYTGSMLANRQLTALAMLEQWFSVYQKKAYFNN